jgi:NCS2 family nucleobase:cation symporter-2/xanthine permease XanP
MFTGQAQPAASELRFSASENPPGGLSLLLAMQTVALIIAGIVLTPAIVLRGAGMPESMEAAVIFFALLVCGITTVIQARRVWRFGAGYILLMGTSGAFIAVGITALELGGMPLLMTLIVTSSLIQFLLAHKLVLLRRVITPLVGGTTIMLLAVTVMPIAFNQFPEMSEGGRAYEAPVVAGVSLVTILCLSFFGSKQLRLWAPIVGIVAGSVLAWWFGDFNGSRISEAAWFGVPSLSWTGLDLSFGAHFWMLLPAFIIVTVVGAIETFGDAIAVQHISHRHEHPVDFRTVQGALNADGLGNLLSGLLGTMPNTTYSTSISVVDLTGVASRRVGLFCGAILLALAFFPKISAVILSIPAPVVGAYLIVLILLLFMHGVRMVARDGLSYEKGFIVGMGFWLGVGFQQKAIFNDVIPGRLAPILDNGMTSGTLVTVLLVALLGLRRSAKMSLDTRLSMAAMPQVTALAERFASRKLKADQRASDRLRLISEETVLALIEMRDRSAEEAPVKLHLELQEVGGRVELSVGVAPLDQDMRDLIDASQEGSKPLAMSDLPFRMLGGLVDELQHYRYFGLDFITVRFDLARVALK